MMWPFVNGRSRARHTRMDRNDLKKAREEVAAAHEDADDRIHEAREVRAKLEAEHAVNNFATIFRDALGGW